jgi:flagellar motor switch protein FliG
MSAAAAVSEVTAQPVPLQEPALFVENRPVPPKLPISAIRKAAILMITLGDELARLFYPRLSEIELQRLTEEIGKIRDVPPALAAEVLEEFNELVDTQQYMMHGGMEYATKLLVDAFGKERAEDLLTR